MPLHLLTDTEVNILQRLLDLHRGELAVAPLRSPGESQFNEGEDHQAPETYIAFVPAAGLPALTPDPDTGTAGFAIPGSVSCNIFKIVDSFVGTADPVPELKAIGISKTVYNLNTAGVPEGWISVHRTKFGRWVADISPGLVRMCHGTLVADLATSDAEMEIDNVVTIFGPEVKDEDGGDFATGTGTDTSLTVKNVHSHSGSANDRVTAVFCVEDDQWEEIQIDC